MADNRLGDLEPCRFTGGLGFVELENKSQVRGESGWGILRDNALFVDYPG